MISDGVRSAQRVIDRQRKIDYGPSYRSGRGKRRRKYSPDIPDVPDGGIFDDCRNIIKYERAGKTIVIRRYGRDNDKEETERRCRGRFANGGLLSRRFFLRAVYISRDGRQGGGFVSTNTTPSTAQSWDCADKTRPAAPYNRSLA